jgi:S-formylglutathione hydrolase FrmB
MPASRLSSVALFVVVVVLAWSHVPGAGQQPGRLGGTLERVTVHGRSLEGNLEGDAPDRHVVVYLPPSYARETSRRYPVLYYLHGYTATAEAYVKVLRLPDSVDRAIASGTREMIVVLPDAMTKYGGSMYSNSPTIGDWETFIAQELPAFIDARYRTVASREGRGLAGHSMGGYGTMRVGMKQPSAFAALYAMSSCCLMNDPAAGRGAGARGQGAPGRGDGAGRGDGRAAGAGRGGGMANALAAQAAAWAPNPMNPPDFFDLPTRDGQVQPIVAAKWPANSPLVMVDQHVPALKSMRAIALDIGNQDPFLATNQQLADALTRLKVPSSLEVYEGDHGNRVGARFESHVLPFFAKHVARGN